MLSDLTNTDLAAELLKFIDAKRLRHAVGELIGYIVVTVMNLLSNKVVAYINVLASLGY